MIDPKPGLTDAERDRMALWNSWRTPPASALKSIKGGRLSGMTDIDPMWRIGSLTRAFGPVGVGWYYEVAKTWTVPELAQGQPMPDGEIMVFAEVWLRTAVVRNGEPLSWSKPIIGIGGNRLVSKEKGGLHANDDGYKMAVTDALGGCCKLLGIGADVYAGRMDDSKFSRASPEEATPARPPSGTAQPSKLCSECGGPMWDNTKDKPYPNAPDFKCKKCGHKEWIREAPAPPRPTP